MYSLSFAQTKLYNYGHPLYCISGVEPDSRIRCCGTRWRCLGQQPPALRLSLSHPCTRYYRKKICGLLPSLFRTISQVDCSASSRSLLCTSVTKRSCENRVNQVRNTYPVQTLTIDGV